ncbi:MAG: IclR family transcriptional regulator [Pseudomonadota bacterium]
MGSSTAAVANSTADRVIEVLLLFNYQRPAWTANDLAARLDMPRSTLYRYLTSLKNAKMIEEQGDGVFRLGPRIQVLAGVAKSSVSFAEIARGEMLRLSEVFNETLLLNELVDFDIATLERVESRQRIRLSVSRGSLLPWPATASSKLLLAHADPETAANFWSFCAPQAYTAKTIVDRHALESELAGILKRGYAYSDEERDTGVVAVAVPVSSRYGYKRSLSLVAPKFRMGFSALDEARHALQSAAESLAARED